LLQKLATRIVELDRGNLINWPGGYKEYLRRKQEFLDTETSQRAKFDKKLAQEETWIRQGIKARRTRNEGRVRALLDLRQERQQRRNVSGNVRMQIQEAERSGKLVSIAEDISFSFSDAPVVKKFSTTILRGDRIGIMGPNGVGKTTLLRILLGKLTPQHGTIRLGTNIEICYFDQHREQLDLEKSVADNLADGHDNVILNGKPRHVIGYLQDFLFPPERARTPVRILSGGERNRLLLAKLFTKPSNVLVMDEPTNDLDAETLDLLEDLLLEYSGTLLLVSHDREFLNNVVTSTLVLSGDGQVREYVGGYDDWLRQAAAETPAAKPQSAKAPADTSTKTRDRGEKPRKLSFKEERELEALPERIHQLEEEQECLHATLADPEFYRGAGAEVAVFNCRLEELEGELEAAYARWEELEGLKG
ncbi:MAG TPA: ABC transporter ATP-binding protein, partial [Geobacter sulfurreducens]|nr:ABC transporter ATP-binding protein [Geobacter sulfurreducens]